MPVVEGALRITCLLWVLMVSNSAFAMNLALPNFKGSLVQGGLVVATLDPGSKVYLQGKSVAVAANGQFSLGFDRDAPAKLNVKIEAPSGQSAVYVLDIARRDYAIQRIEGIAKKIMSPSEVDLTRIRAEARGVRKARSQLIERMDFAGSFQWPLTGPITGVYGSQRVYNGEPKRPHYGVDVAAPTGTPLTTPAPGVVTLAHKNMFYSGGTIIIDHGYGLSSTLMHLSEVLVKVGDELNPGDIIAKVGATGRATGPHLDWRMNWNQSRIDPQLLVPDMIALKNASKTER